MSIPYFQLIHYVNGDNTRTISGLVTRFQNCGWIEGVNDKYTDYYQIDLTFEERGKGCLELELRSGKNINIYRLPRLVTVRYSVHKELDADLVYWEITHQVSALQYFKTPLKVREPDFFSGV
jgi:hypothetical protein